MTFEGDENEQDPTVHLWMLYFVAQHFYFRRNFENALSYINQAIEHTPTVVDLYVLKAKIYKAEKTMAIFSKDSGDDAGLNVHDMQCMWYESECGASYLR